MEVPLIVPIVSVLTKVIVEELLVVPEVKIKLPPTGVQR